jgi:predicted component of type VI protein secretion system
MTSVAMLRISRGGRVEGLFYLPDEPVVIGRAESADIQLLDSRVSRKHAFIRQSVAGFMVQDSGTKNGTFVNREAVEKSLLFHGDVIVIGGYSMEFLEEESVGELNTADISYLDDTAASPSLRADGRPKAKTIVDPSRPPPQPVNRMNRQRYAEQPVEQSIGVPLIEGIAPAGDEPERGGFDQQGASIEFSLSELEVVIDELPPLQDEFQAPRPKTQARRVRKPGGGTSPGRHSSGPVRPPWPDSDGGDDIW